MSEQEPSQVVPTSKVVYNDFQELVTEWQASEQERALWEYLGMPEHVFKQWVAKCRAGVFDA
jgi:hypothetical protein